MIMYSSYVSRITDHSVSNIIGKVGYAEVPGSCPTLGGWSLGINKNSTNFNTALSFIKWACSSELSIPLTLLGSLSACRTIYNSEEINALYPWVKKSLDIFSSSHRRSLPWHGPGTSIKRYEEIIARAVHDCITGNDDPDAALKKAAQHLSSMMEA